MLWPDYGHLCPLPSADHRPVPDLSPGRDRVRGPSRGGRLSVVRAIFHWEGCFVRPLRIVSSQNERRTPSPGRAGTHLAGAADRGAPAHSGDASTFQGQSTSRYPIRRNSLGTRCRRISSGDRRRVRNSPVEREGGTSTRVRPPPSRGRTVHHDLHRPPRTVRRGRRGVLRSHSSPLDRSRCRASTPRAQDASGNERYRYVPQRFRTDVASLHRRREHLPFSRRRLIQDRNIGPPDQVGCQPTPNENPCDRCDEGRRATSNSRSSRAWSSTGHRDTHQKTQRSRRRLT